MALLIVLQYVITWLSVRSSRFENIVKSEPTLLLHVRAIFSTVRCSPQRVTRDDVISVLRSQGACDIETVDAVLETDGSMSVLANALDRASRPTLQGLTAGPAENT